MVSGREGKMERGWREKDSGGAGKGEVRWATTGRVAPPCVAFDGG
jgi:hypothetical protein